ncbi:hypothetical protein H0A36_24920 [Endozoicomonas sp. SM1973]|uniref:Uncharacterized protein n=1 Tax=Spartinivicinus marinus TaxID=2994442 RepID=A0A853IN67_9GAMM|nr:hypothetical protein [Spartinivicinus marinus]MCX4030313.1 hypothetical protein [Spartinivicinus marinus]NYZ69266.1 hypothetical protein [Spartinivicinus marinus]
MLVNKKDIYWVNADVTIDSDLDVVSLAKLISTILNMPPFILDDSGDWEGDEVYASSCFGFDFLLSADDSPLNSFHLSLVTDGEVVDLDQNTIQIKFDNNLVSILSHHGLNVKARFED